jgi:hypothetical protein
LDQSLNEFRLVFGNRTESISEIVVQSRSLLQIMQALAQQIEVPKEDEPGATQPKMNPTPSAQVVQRRFKVRVGSSRPARSYTSVKYRGNWYWIEDNDLDSKRIFALMILLFSFGDSKPEEALPVLTIPVN